MASRRDQRGGRFMTQRVSSRDLMAAETEYSPPPARDSPRIAVHPLGTGRRLAFAVEKAYARLIEASPKLPAATEVVMSQRRPSTACPSSVAHALPRWKKLVYGLVATSLFFLLLEMTLFWSGVEPLLVQKDPFVGFAFEVRHFEERAELGESPQLKTARNKLGHLNDQSFAARKEEGTFRIFCLGGSTTFGRPYDDATSFVGWLRTLLGAALPETNWEVINAGGISYASYRVAALMEELVEYEPDLFVIYSGHNEFLEERTYRELRAASPAVRWLTLSAARTRTGALIHRLCAASPPDANQFELSEEVDTILDRTVGPESYERDDRLKRQVVQHYEFSLRRMIDLARSCGAEIVVVAPAANLSDCSPFKSQPRDDLTEKQHRQWQEHLEQARRLQQQEQHRKAVQVLSEAQAIDNRAAEAYFLLGRSLIALGDHEQAQLALQRAADEDVCPLRITTDLRRALDSAVLQEQVATVDFPELLRRQSLREHGDPFPGGDYFLDHVHPTIEAHGLLAQALLRQLQEMGVVAGKGGVSQQAYQTARQRIEARIDRAAQARAEANLACVLHWAGKTEEAGPLALQALDHIDSDPRIYLIAGIYLHGQDQTAKALVYLERALQLSPNDPRIRRALNEVRRPTTS